MTPKQTPFDRPRSVDASAGAPATGPEPEGIVGVAKPPGRRLRTMARTPPPVAAGGNPVATTPGSKRLVVASSGVPAAPSRVINMPAAKRLLATLDTPPSGDLAPRWHAVLGCKTPEVASALLAQLIKLERPCPDPTALPAAQLDSALMTATATLAELQPATATEALLAAQMVGAQRAAMTYLHRALMPEQESEAIDGTSPVPCA